MKSGDVKGPKPKAAAPSVASEILVKSIQLKPTKEAIILYRGRLYTVRPGDSLGGKIVEDITQSGIKIGSGRAR